MRSGLVVLRARLLIDAVGPRTSVEQEWSQSDPLYLVLCEPTWPFHVLLAVPLEPEQIEAIGAREGWRAKTFGRGMRGRKPFFHVIEFWLENRLMIEVVSPGMAREYEEKNAQTEVMGDPDAVRLMRATHVKEPA